ncbi:MAG: hypothetical protein ACTMUP_06170 [cyanobacterium endosymbiont of Rhopalodia musculus]
MIFSLEKDYVDIRTASVLEKELMKVDTQHDNLEEKSAAVSTFFQEKIRQA